MIDFNALSFGRKKAGAGVGVARSLRHNPERDWRVVFFGFVLLSLSFIGVGVYLYRSISAGDPFAAATQAPGSLTILNTFELEKTVAFFADRSARFQALKAGRIQSPDPGAPPGKP